jgi:membrane-associated phospholipid phosphatase
MEPTDDTLAVSGSADGIRPLPLPGPVDWITNLPMDWWDWGKNTFQVKWLPLAGVITAATVATVVTDDKTYLPLKDEYNRTPWFREASDYAVWIGDGKFQFGIASAFAVTGFIFNDTVALRTASQITEVILACGGVVQLLKHTTGREAPFTATTPTGRWALFPNQIEYHKHVPHYDAFPSGHLATALATLTVIAENYPQQKWIRWIGYPALGALTVGMVAQGIHWWSDYPLSIALGYSFGMLLSHRDDKEVAEDVSLQGGLLQLPQVTLLSDGTPALQMSWRW